MNTDSNLFENVNTDTIHGVELYVLHLTALLETLFHLPGTRHCTYYYRISFLAHILRFSVYKEKDRGHSNNHNCANLFPCIQ